MAAIAGKNTRPELRLRSAVFARGLRYRLHVKNLPGSPDMVFPMYRAAVFVHGCFWHRHAGCRFTTVPKSNAAFWAIKFAGNVRRDSTVREALRKAEWRVAVVWECALRHSGEDAAHQLELWLRFSDQSDIEIAETQG